LIIKKNNNNNKKIKIKICEKWVQLWTKVI